MPAANELLKPPRATGNDKSAASAPVVNSGEAGNVTAEDRRLVESATPDRQARTLDEAKAAAKAFVGKRLENRVLRLKGTVSKTNLGKMASESATIKSVSPESHALAIANADKLFENATLDYPTGDKRAEPTIAAIHRLYAPMLMPDGDVLAVKLTVKETTGPNEPSGGGCSPTARGTLSWPPG
ncbi:MAG: hypothetical protein LBI87_10660 [Candidatus Accumulibacter sp.]|jgi:hypothetical protein|nr:hypothetical protein [Accumulibacter sp.]